MLGVARYTDVTVRTAVRYNFGTIGKNNKSSMLGFLLFIQNREYYSSNTKYYITLHYIYNLQYIYTYKESILEIDLI